ncbi:Lrp/AsnC ligand binding domain-containing protein [[Eubacterium] cellulosolvens]
MISACVLIRTEHGKFDQVIERLRQFKEIREIFPVHGRYDVVADVEAADFESLGDAVLKMNRMAGVVFTESAIEIKRKGV